jgi:predicted RNA binding protein YcfA (HicA-like mRNA interferase family)
MQLHDIERELLRGGWYLVRIRGSHRHYRQDGSRQRLTVSIHGGRHTPVSWRQVAQIEKDLRRLEAAVAASA